MAIDDALQRPGRFDKKLRVSAPTLAGRLDILSALLRKVPDGADGQPDWREAIALLVCPMDEEASRAWFRLAVPAAETDDDALSAFQHTIFGQDRPVLESQRPRRLPLDGAERHSAADRLSTAYRRWLHALGVRFGTC